MKNIIIVFLSFWFFTDLVATLSQLDSPYFYELNPIANYFIVNYGAFGLCCFKTTISFISLLILNYCFPRINDFGKNCIFYSCFIIISIWTISWCHYIYLSVNQ